MEWHKAKDSIARLWRLTQENDRDPASLEISLFERSIPDAHSLEAMEAAGVKRIILTLLGQSRDEALPRLDQLAEINR